MKKIFCVIAISATLAACGSGSSGTNTTDPAAKIGPDTSVHSIDSSSMMMTDTTHKDTTHK